MDKKNIQKYSLQELLNEFSGIKDDLFIIYKEVMSTQMLTTNEASEYDERLTELERKFEKLKDAFEQTKNKKSKDIKLKTTLDYLLSLVAGGFLVNSPEITIIILIVKIFLKKIYIDTDKELAVSVNNEKSLRKDIAVMIQNTSTFIDAKNKKYLDYEAKNSKAVEVEQLIVDSMVQNVYNITNNQDTCPLVLTPIEELKLVREKNKKGTKKSNEKDVKNN